MEKSLVQELLLSLENQLSYLVSEAHANGDDKYRLAFSEIWDMIDDAKIKFNSLMEGEK